MSFKVTRSNIERGRGGEPGKNRRTHCKSKRYCVIEVGFKLKCLNNFALLEFLRKKVPELMHVDSYLDKLEHRSVFFPAEFRVIFKTKENKIGLCFLIC